MELDLCAEGEPPLAHSFKLILSQPDPSIHLFRYAEGPIELQEPPSHLSPLLPREEGCSSKSRDPHKTLGVHRSLAGSCAIQ